MVRVLFYFNDINSFVKSLNSRLCFLTRCMLLSVLSNCKQICHIGNPYRCSDLKLTKPSAMGNEDNHPNCPFVFPTVTRVATYWENSCSFGLRYVSWYKCLIVSLVFSHLGFWSGNLFLIAPFPDLCLLVPF